MTAEIMDFKKKIDPLLKLPAVCIDIETCNASENAINQELELWKPPSNWKPETVEKNRAEQAEKIREKSALLDSAPIASIAICDNNGGVAVFHCLLLEMGQQEEGYYSHRSEGEREMLIAFREWANTCTDENTVIVGFNLGFDLPHLRIAYTRHGLKLPKLLIPHSGNRITDVMYLFSKYFTSKDLPFISLDEVAKRLGIASDGKQLHGADVPVYVASGEPEKHRSVITYNAIDTLLTMRAFLICTGQAGE
jgi:hypothetical protein